MAMDKIAGIYWMKRHGGKGKAHAFPGEFARNQAVCGQVISNESWDMRINADGSITGPPLIDARLCGTCGILNPNWRGGLASTRYEIYSTKAWKNLKSKVYKRDRSCRLCGNLKELQIHHIEPFSQAPLLLMCMGNLILLCPECHVRLKGKEKQWRKKLYQRIEGGGAE